MLVGFHLSGSANSLILDHTRANHLASSCCVSYLCVRLSRCTAYSMCRPNEWHQDGASVYMARQNWWRSMVCGLTGSG